MISQGPSLFFKYLTDRLAWSIVVIADLLSINVGIKLMAMIVLDLAKRRGEALLPPAKAEINLVAHF
jgi:hypothetical protein